ELREEAVRAAAHATVERSSHAAQAVCRLAGLLIQVAVGRGRAYPIEVARHATDRGRVAASVVVDDDHEITIVVVRDVVESLPGHAARESAVTENRDDVSVVAAGAREGARDAVGPAQGAGGVGGLDDVVLTLGTLRVAGQAAARTKLGEVLAPRQQLVHVRLVPRVPHDRVVRRVEDAMMCDRLLVYSVDRPQVYDLSENAIDEVIRIHVS